MSQEKDHKHAALVTDLGFYLDQLQNLHPEMPPVAIELLEGRVAHYETELGIASFAVASTTELTPLPAAAEHELMTVAA